MTVEKAVAVAIMAFIAFLLSFCRTISATATRTVTFFVISSGSSHTVRRRPVGLDHDTASRYTDPTEEGLRASLTEIAIRPPRQTDTASPSDAPYEDTTRPVLSAVITRRAAVLTPSDRLASDSKTSEISRPTAASKTAGPLTASGSRT